MSWGNEGSLFVEVKPMVYSPVTWNDTYLLFTVICNCGLYSEYLSYLI